MPRYFTLSEARAALPETGRLVHDAVQAKDRYQQAEGALQELSQRIMMMGGITVDTAAAEAWKHQRDSCEQSLRNLVERLEEAGCVVKDLDVGLIDFPTLFRGEEVYLCWKLDEADIEFWHGVHEGFAGRRPIDRQFIENHRGDSV